MPSWRSSHAQSSIPEPQAGISHSHRKNCARNATRFDQEVKRYFPEPQVLEGMFRLVETLYGIRILPDVAETWHSDVRFFEGHGLG